MLLSAPEVTMRASGQRRKRLMGSVAWQRERVSDGLRQRVNMMRNQEQEALLSVQVDIWFSPGQSATGSMKWPVQLCCSLTFASRAPQASCPHN